MADSLYCICRKPYESLQFMIQCDSCEEWFHGSCVGIEEHQAPDIERYHCPDCAAVHGPLTLKKRRNWHRHDYSELDDGSKAIQTGTVKFVKELKNRKFPSGDQVILKLKGKELTLEYLEKNGFNKPLKVEKKDGLGLVVPDQSFSIIDVERHVGSVRELDVIDVSRQEDYKMKMREWTEYFLNPVRKKTMNVISLEFSNSSLSKLVRAPTVVGELDWANHVWPPDAFSEDRNTRQSISSPHKKPLVAKYCLMGVKDCYTDFHVDFGGTSVWYHVLWGEKTFYFVAPTKANLQQYEKWVTSAHQSEIFFGDLVEKCYKCTLKAGQTLFIPTGWIHAVFTHVDTLVFGGNFLHSLNIGLQLDVYELEMKLKTPEKFRFPCCETMNWHAAIYLLDKVKGIHESGKKTPPYLVKGLQDMADSLKKWTTKGDPLFKQHKFYIPDGVQPGKLIKSIMKELKKDEKTNSKSKPPSPQRDEKTDIPSVSLDSSKAVIKIKKSKSQKSSAAAEKVKSFSEEDSLSSYHCEVDSSKPVIRIANPSLNQERERRGEPVKKGICLRISNPAANQEGVSFEEDPVTLPPKRGRKKGASTSKKKENSLSRSYPSLKVKLPVASPEEENEAADLLNLSSPADSGLKFVVSNGKIISNNNNTTQKTRKIAGKQFQPLIQESPLQQVSGQKEFSCTPSQQGLRLKLSKNGIQTGSQESSDSEELSDDELAFSVGGSPIVDSKGSRSTLGSLGTTQGLFSTGKSDRGQQPVALLSPQRNFRAEIEEAKLLLFGAEKMSESTELLNASQRSLPGGLNSQSILSSPDRGRSRLNSKRAHSASEDDDEESEEEDLGFGDSDYFKDTKYVYPPLAEMADEDKGNWKPGQKKKKSERIDATWNPKSKVVCSPSKDQKRPARQASRRSQSSGEGGLLNSPPPTGESNPMFNTSSLNKPQTVTDQASNFESNTNVASTSDCPDQAPVKAPSKRGRHKAVTTTKQRLAKILKLDKSGRFMR